MTTPLPASSRLTSHRPLLRRGAADADPCAEDPPPPPPTTTDTRGPRRQTAAAPAPLPAPADGKRSGGR